MAERWGLVLGCGDPQEKNGRIEIELGRSRIGFVSGAKGREEGIGAFEVAAIGADATSVIPRVIGKARERGLEVCGSSVSICGIEIRFISDCKELA